MLVLTRKKDEGIIIGESISITIIDVKGGQVRIGIDAPQDIKIFRRELYEQIKKENEEAVSWKPEDLENIAAVFSTLEKDT